MWTFLDLRFGIQDLNSSKKKIKRTRFSNYPLDKNLSKTFDAEMNNCYLMKWICLLWLRKLQKNSRRLFRNKDFRLTILFETPKRWGSQFLFAEKMTHSMWVHNGKTSCVKIESPCLFFCDKRCQISRNFFFIYLFFAKKLSKRNRTSIQTKNRIKRTFIFEFFKFQINCSFTKANFLVVLRLKTPGCFQMLNFELWLARKCPENAAAPLADSLWKAMKAIRDVGAGSKLYPVKQHLSNWRKRQNVSWNGLHLGIWLRNQLFCSV